MKKWIVIIDDDEDVREVMSFALENEEIPVKCFASADSAYSYLIALREDEWPGLIIVDYHMPGMDGLTFIGEIRKSKLKKVPIAISSGDALEHGTVIPEDVIWLAKPLELDHLLKTVRKILL